MAYQVKTDKFEGPLEILLDLIEKEKLNINEISLAQVTDQYIKYLGSLSQVSPELLANFLVIASQLILIKSKTLIPKFEVSTEEEKSIKELKLRLAELQILKNATKKLQNLNKNRNPLYSRDPYKGIITAFIMPPNLTINKLISSLEELFKTLIKPEKLKKETIKLIVSLEDKITELKKRFNDVLEHNFSKLVQESKSRLEIIITFIALLELTKQKFIKLNQKNHFEDIQIKKL